MQRLLPLPVVDLDDDALRASYGFPDQRPWVRASMVSTMDGATRGPDGRSGSVSSAADKRIFSALRSGADVILVGAGTVRDEGYRPSRLPLGIVTGRLDLEPSLPLFVERTETTPRSIVLTTAAAQAKAPDWLTDVADVVACGATSVDLRWAVDHLHARGLSRIHCEGGPGLLSSLAGDDLIDEFLLTVTPQLVGAAGAHHILNVPAGLPSGGRWSLAQVLVEDGSTFLRVRRP